MRSGFSIVPLRRIARVQNGGTPGPHESNWEGDVPWATPVDLGRVHGGYLQATERSITATGLQSGSTLAPAGSVLISSRAPIGYAAIAGMDTAFNQGCKALIPLPGVSQPRFLKYAVESQMSTLQAAGRGSTFTEVSASDVASLPVPVTSLAKQDRIADYLDRETAEIDEFITELGKLLALTTERLRSEAAELLTPPSQIGSGWINAHLGPLVSIATGQVDPQNDPYRGMPLIAPNHIESRTSRLLGLETAEEQGADSGKYLAREGQVLFSKIRPTLMKSTLAPADCLTSADIYPIDANSRFLTNAFLLEYLLGPQFEGFAARESARVAMPKLNRETLSAAPISLPPLEYQHRMVKKMQKARLHAREHLAEVETAVRLGQERRAALISAAVTGQIDVSAQGVSTAEQLRDQLEVHV